MHVSSTPLVRHNKGDSITKQDKMMKITATSFHHNHPITKNVNWAPVKLYTADSYYSDVAQYWWVAMCTTSRMVLEVLESWLKQGVHGLLWKEWLPMHTWIGDRQWFHLREMANKILEYCYLQETLWGRQPPSVYTIHSSNVRISIISIGGYTQSRPRPRTNHWINKWWYFYWQSHYSWWLQAKQPLSEPYIPHLDEWIWLASWCRLLLGFITSTNRIFSDSTCSDAHGTLHLTPTKLLLNSLRQTMEIVLMMIVNIVMISILWRIQGRIEMEQLPPEVLSHLLKELWRNQGTILNVVCENSPLTK